MVEGYPRLRVHVRKGKGGQVYVYHFYDMRPDGKPDIALGKDRTEALKKWDEIHNRKPRIAGTLLQAFEDWETKVLPTYESAETKRGYTKNLRWLKAKFGPATWDGVTLPHLKAYLTNRKAKTQANREVALLSVIWNWARVEGLTTVPYPAAGMARSKWKNKEKPRVFEVTSELFAATYAEADQVLRDAMDLASATAMRITDVRTIVMPRDGVLRLDASKTGKLADFDVNLSQVLPGLVERRKGYKASHLMLLSTPTGRAVSYGMLRDRWDAARAAAAEKARKAGDEEFARTIEAMYLRDMRKLASNLAGSLREASELLQHSSEALTRTHYRTQADRLKPVR